MKKHILFLFFIILSSYTVTKANDHKVSNIGISLSLNEPRDFINSGLLKVAGCKIINISKTICILSLPVYENCPLGTSVLSGWLEITYNCETGSTLRYNFVASGRPCRLPVA